MGFSGNYHEALAACWWRMHRPGEAPTDENGGVQFILASSGADIRGATHGMKPLRSYPDAWSSINWRHFHTAKGSAEFLAAAFPKGAFGRPLSEVLKKATPEILEKDFLSGKTLAAVAINERQLWIARGWAFHNLADQLGVQSRFGEMAGGNGKYLPDAVLIESQDSTDTTSFLDNYNDAMSAFWAGLRDADPKTWQQVHDIFSDPERGGRLLADFAFVLQRGYDACGADDLGMASSLERAQKVMLPVVNEFAHGIKMSLLGREFVFGWGFTEKYAERETYAREVALPELFKLAEAKARKGAQ